MMEKGKVHGVKRSDRLTEGNHAKRPENAHKYAVDQPTDQLTLTDQHEGMESLTRD